MPSDTVTYVLSVAIVVIFCTVMTRNLSDADTSRPPTGHYRLASIQDTLTSNVSLCVVCNGAGSCIEAMHEAPINCMQ